MPTEPWRGIVAVVQEAAAGSWRAAEQDLLSSSWFMLIAREVVEQIYSQAKSLGKLSHFTGIQDTIDYKCMYVLHYA